MTEQGWKTYTPKVKRNNKYETRLVVILSSSKSRHLYISNPLMEKLGNPKKIAFHTRGSNVGLSVPIGDEIGYTVSHGKGSTMPFLNIKGFVDDFNIQPGVYDVHIETSSAGVMAVFDTQSTPSKK